MSFLNLPCSSPLLILYLQQFQH
uniref:Uncharacterized protein n=1 Tax=Arundo donax TaxID=35708 RepID=A0A0A9BB20_ARUDO